MTDEHDHELRNDGEFDERELRQLRAHVKNLPAEIAPTDTAWDAIQKRIEASRVRALPTAFDGSSNEYSTSDTNDVATRATERLHVRPTHSQKRSRIVMLSAASVLIAVTSIVAFREREARRQVIATAEDTTPDHIVPAAAPVPTATVTTDTPAIVAPPGLDNTVVAALAQYNTAANDLAKDLDARRSHLQPDALAVVDSCLRTLDQAIRESNEALRESPTNSTIIELLQLSYQQKLDLLRRSADLPTVSLQD